MLFRLLLGKQFGDELARLIPVCPGDDLSPRHDGVQIFLRLLDGFLGLGVFIHRTFQFPERLAVGKLQVDIRQCVLQFFQVRRTQLSGRPADIFLQLVAKCGERLRTLCIQIAEYIGKVDGLLEFPEIKFFQFILAPSFQHGLFTFGFGRGNLQGVILCDCQPFLLVAAVLPVVVYPCLPVLFPEQFLLVVDFLHILHAGNHTL